MTQLSTTRERAESFLARSTFAVIGVSRNKSDFSRKLFTLLHRRGGTVYAVNPNLDSFDGIPCYHHIADVPTPPDGALLMVANAALPSAIQECLAAGVPRLWIYGIGRPRNLDLRSRELCCECNVELINGLCPYMFVGDSGWFHRLHGWIAARSRHYRASTV